MKVPMGLVVPRTLHNGRDRVCCCYSYFSGSGIGLSSMQVVSALEHQTLSPRLPLRNQHVHLASIIPQIDR